MKDAGSYQRLDSVGSEKPVFVAAHKHTDASIDRSLLWHEALEVKLFFSSGTLVTVGDELFEAKAGDVFLIAPLVPHCTEDPDPRNDYHMIEIDTASVPLLPGSAAAEKLEALRQGALVLPKLVRNHDRLREAVDALARAVPPDGGVTLTVLGSTLLLLDEILALAAPANERQLQPRELLALNKRLSPALELIHREYSRPLTLKELSAACGVEEGYFCRLFRRRTGGTCLQYLSSIRIQNACVLLRAGDKPLGEIASDCGFSSPDWFSREFRARMGCSPRQYRQRAAKKEKEAP